MEQRPQRLDTMSYVDLLKEKTDLFGSLISLGMDPVLEKIPLEGTVEEKISNFYVAMLDACVSEDVMPSTVKPNIAYFEQYGFEGLKALKSILEHCSVLIKYLSRKYRVIMAWDTQYGAKELYQTLCCES